jgi:hypothetical protein
MITKNETKIFSLRYKDIYLIIHTENNEVNLEIKCDRDNTANRGISISQEDFLTAADIVKEVKNG